MLYFLLPDNANKLVLVRLDDTADIGFVSCNTPDNTIETFSMPAPHLRSLVEEVKANKARFQTII